MRVFQNPCPMKWCNRCGDLPSSYVVIGGERLCRKCQPAEEAQR